MPQTDTPRTIDAVRRFHRVYDARMGSLHACPENGRFSETQAKVILELGLTEPSTATSLRKALGLAAGYMSRILTRLHGDGLVEKTPSIEDRRRTLLTLTEEGRAARAELDELVHASVADVIAPLSSQDRERLVREMATIVTLLEGGAAKAGGTEEGSPAYLLRVLCKGVGRGGQATHAPGRAGGTRVGYRAETRGRVRPVRPAGGVPAHDVVDIRRAARGSARIR